MWIYRRVDKISCTERIAKAVVPRQINKDREFIFTVKLRETAYLGHVIRSTKYKLLQSIIEGKIDGKKRLYEL